MRHLAMLLTSAAILRMPPEGQSAAADGADAPIDTAQEQTDKPLATEVVEQAASTDTVGSQAPETSDEQAPEPTPPKDAGPTADDLQKLADAIENMSRTVGQILPIVDDLAERLAAIEETIASPDKSEGPAVVKMQVDSEPLREMIDAVLKPLADLPERVQRLEQRFKHF